MDSKYKIPCTVAMSSTLASNIPSTSSSTEPIADSMENSAVSMKRKADALTSVENKLLKRQKTVEQTVANDANGRPSTTIQNRPKFYKIRFTF